MSITYYTASWEKEHSFKPDINRARTDFKPHFRYRSPPRCTLHGRHKHGDSATCGHSHSVRSNSSSARPGSSRPGTAASTRSTAANGSRPGTAALSPTHHFQPAGREVPEQLRTAAIERHSPTKRQQRYASTVLANNNEDLRESAPLEWMRQRELMAAHGVDVARQTQAIDPRYRDVGEFPNSPAMRRYHAPQSVTDELREEIARKRSQLQAGRPVHPREKGRGLPPAHDGPRPGSQRSRPGTAAHPAVGGSGRLGSRNSRAASSSAKAPRSEPPTGASAAHEPEGIFYDEKEGVYKRIVAYDTSCFDAEAYQEQRTRDDARREVYYREREDDGNQWKLQKGRGRHADDDSDSDDDGARPDPNDDRQKIAYAQRAKQQPHRRVFVDRGAGGDSEEEGEDRLSDTADRAAESLRRTFEDMRNTDYARKKRDDDERSSGTESDDDEDDAHSGRPQPRRAGARKSRAPQMATNAFTSPTDGFADDRTPVKITRADEFVPPASETASASIASYSHLAPPHHWQPAAAAPPFLMQQGPGMWSPSQQMGSPYASMVPQQAFPPSNNTGRQQIIVTIDAPAGAVSYGNGAPTPQQYPQHHSPRYFAYGQDQPTAPLGFAGIDASSSSAPTLPGGDCVPGYCANPLHSHHSHHSAELAAREVLVAASPARLRSPQGMMNPPHYYTDDAALAQQSLMQPVQQPPPPTAQHHVSAPEAWPSIYSNQPSPSAPQYFAQLQSQAQSHAASTPPRPSDRYGGYESDVVNVATGDTRYPSSRGEVGATVQPSATQWGPPRVEESPDIAQYTSRYAKGAQQPQQQQPQQQRTLVAGYPPRPGVAQSGPAQRLDLSRSSTEDFAVQYYSGDQHNTRQQSQPFASTPSWMEV